MRAGGRIGGLGNALSRVRSLGSSDSRASTPVPIVAAHLHLFPFSSTAYTYPSRGTATEEDYVSFGSSALNVSELDETRFSQLWGA